MQIRKALWAMLLLFFVFFQFCGKNDHPGPSQQTPPSSIISLEDAQRWTAANVTTSANARGTAKNYIGQPSWTRTTQIKVLSGQGILKVALEKYNIPFGYRDLLFQQQADGSVRSVIQQVHMDSAYLAAKISSQAAPHGIRHYVQDEDFSGDVVYLSPRDNHFLFGWRYQNGQAKFRLKPGRQASLARSGGGPLDNDEDNGDDGGGGSDPGWTGTGNNTDGYTIDGPEITAPAPSNNNPPPYIPSEDPGVNPPTIPVGGGSTSGGTGGVKNSPKADENYEDPKVEVEAIPCPNSYNFVKQGNWQSAVITGYYFQFFDQTVNKMFDVQIGTIETGMPAITYDGSLIQASVAQAMATQAARNAEHMVAMAIAANIIANPRLTPDQVRNNIRYVDMFKTVYAEELNAFLRADYGYRDDAHPVTVSTSQSSFSLKDVSKWLKLKFFGKDC